MARPKKQTVDYFPHYVNHGKTIMILENEFGNDGYAFWFKLLELLCSCDGQLYDYNSPASWRLLLAKTHTNEETANKILQLLAEVKAIDPELYDVKVIWSQNLIDHLELVYNRRSTGIPQRPSFYLQKPRSVGISTSKKPQTKLNKTKLNKTKSVPLREFANVVMTKKEYQKLIDEFGEKETRQRIERLSLYKESTGKRYKNDYATILAWARRDKDQEGGNHGGLSSDRKQSVKIIKG